jgi:glycosyltransferase involved in cell wall biosynthesis
MSAPSAVDIVFVWRQNERLPSGRRAESLAAWFSRRPEVRRVIYLEPPLDRKAFDADRRWRKLLPLHVRHVDERFWRLTVLKPNTLVNLDGETAERRTAWLSVRLVQRFLERNTQPERWLWIYPPNPFSTALVHQLSHDRLICDIVDDVVSATETEREHCEALVQQSAATFTTSSDLAARLRPWHRGALYVPNGLEPSFIADIDRPEPPVATTRRVIGYLGVISERTDPALLSAVADRFPECDVRLIGWIDGWSDEIRALLAKPNVHFTDRIPFDAVAKTIDGFDVCLVPHRDNSLSRSMSPLKLFQYVARGKPVVSTPVAGLETVADLIRVAPATEPFLDAIAACLRTEVADPVLRRQRIERAAAHTWPERVRTMWHAISQSGTRAKIIGSGRPADSSADVTRPSV